MKIKHIIVFVVVSCYSWLGMAQQKSAKPLPDAKTMKLFFEKVYLQTDRNYFSTGEDVWFSAYLVNGKSTSLTSSSANLYVELVSPQSAILDKKTILLSKGLGSGDFKLPDSIATGWYNIRAYTNWMRNFGDEFVFQKSIYITNNLKENATYATRNANKKPVGIAESGDKKTITFFPEGGALVEGVNSLVAFKTNDDLGNGLKASGSIVSGKGDTVASFQSTAVGMGLFTFTPKINETYLAVVVFGNEKFSTPLPEILKKGLSLHVTADSLYLKASITANEMMFSEIAGKTLSVVIKHAGDKIYTGAVKMAKQSISVSIPTKGFPAGIAVITLVDDLGKPHCERLIFIADEKKVSYTLKPNKQAYQAREKVVLNVKATDVFGMPVKTNFSLAAVDGLIPDDGNDIRTYLLLQSEIKGEIKNPDQYFDAKNPSRLKQLDLLLLTQGWRAYLWRKFADTSMSVSYLPEPALSIKGFVREKVGNKPLPNMNITLFGSGFTGEKLFTTTTDQNGNYFIDGLKWYGDQPIKISSQDAKGKKGGWLEIDSATKPISITFKRGLQDFTKNIDAEISRRMDYNKTYKFGDSITLNDIQIKADQNKKKVVLFNETVMTFGYPEQVFNITPADYAFNGLEHFLLTKVSGAYPREDVDSVGSEGIAFISNGKKITPIIRVNNREELVGERRDYYSLRMDKINQVKVQHLINNSGTDVYVISLNLKQDALGATNLHLLNLDLTGYYNARTFYSPNYSNPANKNKDLRTTIFWAPKVETNAKGEASVVFYNGDNKGTIVIKTDGITEKGSAVTAKSTYVVQ
ncbi:hypothetical protein ASE92_05920 [Pedobacter sp. Leaf41]|uniref:MG2 domain-containing protein n=1 Tax=Pedobacter sp. Leaf41 TaxID=1736218 RepID=UPI000713AE86|nr:MG2 domain-containing protein [Pedobacter sp. Leaf41]KQN38951.1 hypothetical protein ASE92_05920 [Pedobacter sp. Leaf41]